VFEKATSIKVYEDIVPYECDLGGVLLIEVFVHSHDKYVDIGFYREMSYHWECGLDQWAKAGLQKLFKGRILSGEELTILERVLEKAQEKNQKIKIYDISRIVDRVRAMKRGVMKTPTVIIDEERHQGLSEILEAITNRFGQ